MNKPLIRADHLGYRYPGGDWLFHDLDFHLHGGDILSFNAPTGS